jgi:hypothetical protein
VLRGRKTDPLARRAALGIGAGRVAIGLGTLLATDAALRVLGFAEVGAAGGALARLAGARDLVVGVATIAVREDPEKLRAVTKLGAALDAADALAFSVALRDTATADAGARGVASGAAAALTGAWAANRLSAR